MTVKRIVLFVCMCFAATMWARSPLAAAESRPNAGYNEMVFEALEAIQEAYRDGRLFPQGSQKEVIYTRGDVGVTYTLDHVYGPGTVAAVVSTYGNGVYNEYIRKFKSRRLSGIAGWLETGMKFDDVKRFLRDDTLELNGGIIEFASGANKFVSLIFKRDVLYEVAFYVTGEQDITEIPIKMGDDKFDYREFPVEEEETDPEAYLTMIIAAVAVVGVVVIAAIIFVIVRLCVRRS